MRNFWISYVIVYVLMPIAIVVSLTMQLVTQSDTRESDISIRQKLSRNLPVREKCSELS